MNGKRYYWRSALLTLLLVSIAAAGCSTVTAYKAPLTNYRDANTIVVESARTFITQANQVEREDYIDSQVRSHSEIDFLKMEQTQILTPDQIENRIKALESLSEYGTLLVKIANSDAPQDISDKAKNISTDLNNLAKAVNALHGGEDLPFKTTVDPAINIIGQVAKSAMEKKIQEALDKAVSSGYDPIMNLIDLVSNDASVAYQRQRSYLSAQRKYAWEDYNGEAEKGKDAKADVLKKDADQLKAVLVKWDELPQTNPEKLFGAMREAQRALLAYAGSRKTSKDVEDFTDAMTKYLERVKEVEAALKKLSGAK
ncbi:MAG: hypothetical protein ABSG91_16510 [Syntrophobacteraceae bacterium]|jgi:hypothetical protein